MHTLQQDSLYKKGVLRPTLKEEETLGGLKRLTGTPKCNFNAKPRALLSFTIKGYKNKDRLFYYILRGEEIASCCSLNAV